MKTFLYLLLIGMAVGCATTQPIRVINQKLDSKNSKELLLVRVVSDSRCPEGTQCVWAGEVSFEVAVYENKKLMEQAQFTLNHKSKEEVQRWFEKHLPKTNSKLKTVAVVPYPKEGVKVNPEDYKIVLQY